MQKVLLQPQTNGTDSDPDRPYFRLSPGSELFSAAPWAGLSSLTLTSSQQSLRIIKWLIMEENLDLLHPFWDLSHFGRCRSSSRSRRRACGCPLAWVSRECSITLCSQNPLPRLSSFWPLLFPHHFTWGGGSSGRSAGARIRRGVSTTLSKQLCAWGGW